MLLLAHLSTKYLGGAFRMGMCPSSVVRHPSCVVNNFFKHPSSPPKLLGQFGSNLAGMFLGCPLQKLFTEFDSIKNSGCHGNEMEFFKQFFKNLLPWNHWSDFEMISQKCSLVDPFQKLCAKFRALKNMALVNGGFLHYMDIKKFLKNLLL